MFDFWPRRGRKPDKTAKCDWWDVGENVCLCVAAGTRKMHVPGDWIALSGLDSSWEITSILTEERGTDAEKSFDDPQ